MRLSDLALSIAALSGLLYTRFDGLTYNERRYAYDHRIYELDVVYAGIFMILAFKHLVDGSVKLWSIVRAVVELLYLLITGYLVMYAAADFISPLPYGHGVQYEVPDFIILPLFCAAFGTFIISSVLRPITFFANKTSQIQTMYKLSLGLWYMSLPLFIYVVRGGVPEIMVKMFSLKTYRSVHCGV